MQRQQLGAELYTDGQEWDADVGEDRCLTLHTLQIMFRVGC